MKKTLVLILSLFAFVVFGYSSAFAETEPISDEALKAAMNGTAVIRCGTGMGSAVAIGKVGEPVHYFLSNYHCIADDDWVIYDSPIYIVVGDIQHSGSRTLAEIVYANRIYDFCILKTEEPVRQIVPLTLSNEYVKLGDTIFAVGFSAESLIDEHIYADFDHIVYADGEVTNLSIDVNYKKNQVNDEYMTTMRLTGGYSGGPLLNTNGRVIALNNGSVYNADKDAYTNSYAVKITNIIPYLNMHGIDFALYENDTDKSSIETGANQSSTNVVQTVQTNEKQPEKIILISLAVIIIVGMMIYFIRYNFSKKSSGNTEVERQPVPEVSISEISVKTLDKDPKTRTYKYYKLVVDNKKRELLLDYLLSDGMSYRIAVRGKNIADISVSNEELTITSVSHDNDIFVVDHKENGEIEKHKLPQEADKIVVKIEKTNIYLCDIDHHMEIKNLNGGIQNELI